MDLTPILHGTVLSLLLVGLAHRPWRGGPVGTGAALVTALAFGATYLAGWRALNGWPPLVPAQPAHWLLWLVPVAALATLVERSAASALPRQLPRLALVVGFLAATLPPVVRHRGWEGAELAGMSVLLVLSGLATLWIVAAVALRAGDPAPLEQDGHGAGPGPALVLMVWGGLTAGVLGNGGQSVSALTAGGMNTVVGVACALALLRRERAVLRGASAPFAFGLWALVFVATYYASLEPLPAALVLLAPALALVPLGSLRGIPAALVRALLVAVPGGLAVWLSMPAPNPYGY